MGVTRPPRRAMADGRTHETMNIVALGALAIGYQYASAKGLTAPIDPYLTDENRLIFLASYLLGTYLITPDLDLAYQSVRAKSNWGVLGLLWRPYGIIFSHRGISHTWLAGPFTRLAYLAALIYGFAILIHAFAPRVGIGIEISLTPGPELYHAAVPAVAGYYLSQWAHLLVDGMIFTKGRRRRRKRR